MEGHDIPDTRVFVSGLPPNFTSNQLGAHFAGRYQITDAVVIPDRRIGFVGFRNYTLAKSAIKYFDKTYVRMSKISVMMAQAVEIERTSTSQGFPTSKHGNQHKTHRPSLPESVPSNGHTTSNIKPDRDAGFQPYVPVLSSNKRKRESESESKPQDELSRSAVTAPAMPAAPGHENGLRESSSDEQQARDLKKARKKEKKEKKERRQRSQHNADTEKPSRGEEWQSEPTSAILVTMANKKKAKADVTGSKTANVVAPVSEDLQEGLDAQDRKRKKNKEKRKKNKEPSTTEMDGNDGQVDNHIVDEEDRLRKGTNSRPQVDDDTKGGVEPTDDDALEPPEQSADQSKQQRRKSDITTDKEWLRAKTSRVLDLMDETPLNARSAGPGPEERSSETAAKEEVENTEQLRSSSTEPFAASTRDSLSSSGRLFVRNLPYSTTESDIETLFSKYGHLDEVHLVRDKAGNSKGVVYVQFSKHDRAKDALQELDGKSFQGRLLHILEAATKKSHKLDDFEISKLPLKKQKALKRRIEAGGSIFSWNSMYMNPNAVLSSVADRLGVLKGDLMDVSSADAAVRQAHAETHVIQETKAFLTSNGVNLDAFRQREKDETTLLVKNFPFGTTIEELKSLFGPCGEIVKFLLPSSGTMAIIQYAQPGEGSRAMKQLAYRNLKGSVLYLEIGPKDLFDRSVRSVVDSNSPGDAPTENQDRQSGKIEQGSSTLFVRNLNFVTTTAGLTLAFKPLNGFLSAKVKTKIDPKRPHEVLSMGFGFVEFRSNQQALAALAAMNGHSLDDHGLLVQISRKATDAAEEQRHKDHTKKADAHKTKVIIKNLPFEATKKDVRALLSAYGQLRSVKVPQKFNRDTRGFAFADFVTAREAENAMEALKDTHLLGRRLVLEFAEEDSIDPEVEIRAIESKVGRQTEMIQLNNMTGSARKKFNVGTQDDDQ